MSVDLNGKVDEFSAAVADAFRPVHLAVTEALSRLAEKGITTQTCFDAEAGILIVWMMKPDEEPGGDDNHG